MSISIVQGGPRGQVRVADSSATIVRSAALGPPVLMKPRLARIKSGSNLDTLVRKHAAFVAGQTSPLSQCGGIDYEGPTACAADHTCTEINAWYYQCLPDN
ncbi:hypothetical protein DFH09DRAFT_1094052 [Mycena vulgaris]|nr:hypothetical protein DFH09DRAFT_1099776 [Mycena vulgaris]KAJ6529478.1 hypothetical protein DFH09DRAFT_1094052 [Mycena vulgaris]